MAQNYVTKKCSSAEEVRETIMNIEVNEGYMPAMDDAELYYNTDPEGFFIGELDGKPIGCLSIVKYGESYAFVGTYIVLKEHRGKGYGMPLWKFANSSLPSSYTDMAIFAQHDKVRVYEKSNFKADFMIRRVTVDIPFSLTKLQSTTAPPDVTIQQAKLVDFDKLSAYDDAAFGAPHQRFLKGLLEGSNTITLAATNSAGEVVGFVAARKMIVEKDGWRVAPMYADNGQIARAILKEILQAAIKDSPERKSVMFELATGVNPDACTLAEELNATNVLDFCYMYTKDPVKITKEKIYSFSSVELG